MKTFKEFITEEDDTFKHMFQQLDLKVYSVNLNTDQISITDVDILDTDTFIYTYNRYMSISNNFAKGDFFKTLVFFDDSVNEIIEQMKRVKCIRVKYYTSYNILDDDPYSTKLNPHYNGSIYFALTKNDVVKKVLDDAMNEFYNAGYREYETEREGEKLFDELQDRFNELE